MTTEEEMGVVEEARMTEAFNNWEKERLIHSIEGRPCDTQIST